MKKGKLHKKGNSKVAKTLRTRKDPRVEEIYEEEVEFMCPKRGLVKQKVKIKKFKTVNSTASINTIIASDALSKVEEKDDGLSIFTGEDLDLDIQKE